MNNPMGPMFDAFVNNAINQFEKNAGGNLTPIQQNYINIIRNRDSSQGIPLATNLYQSMGETKEQAIFNASKFFSP